MYGGGWKGGQVLLYRYAAAHHTKKALSKPVQTLQTPSPTITPPHTPNYTTPPQTKPHQTTPHLESCIACIPASSRKIEYTYIRYIDTYVPALSSSKFSGLMSLWMTLSPCRYCSALASWKMYRAATASEKRPRGCAFMVRYSSPFLAYSITINILIE